MAELVTKKASSCSTTYTSTPGTAPGAFPATTGTAATGTATDKPKRRITRKRVVRNAIPDSLLNNPSIAAAISILPVSYSFEIHKTLHQIITRKATRIALQMPEGLLMYGCAISDIIHSFGGPTVEDVIILGDVTYGACCVDDLAARDLGCDYLVHYGHSCLVPINKTTVPMMYVFVEIQVDVEHLVECVMETFASSGTPPSSVSIQIMGTIQFRSAIANANEALRDKGFVTNIPQAKPLSPGEVLGCTAPNKLYSNDLQNNNITQTILFIADGRFHLEAAMMANPRLTAYKYDPYSKSLTEEKYNIKKTREIRLNAVNKARKAKTIGVVLGTLGRQGNPAILHRVVTILSESGIENFTVLLSEIFPQKLALMGADAWVQIACPRLSVDWGHFFSSPVLSVYELEVMLGKSEWLSEDEGYPMDYYKTGDHQYGNYGAENGKRQYAGLDV